MSSKATACKSTSCTIPALRHQGHRDGIKKDITWHAQGLGKTALVYCNARFLTEYFQRKVIIPEFYFIVDSPDLTIQAQREFADFVDREGRRRVIGRFGKTYQAA